MSSGWQRPSIWSDELQIVVARQISQKEGASINIPRLGGNEMSAPSLWPSIEISPSVGFDQSADRSHKHGLTRTVYPLKPNHSPRVNLDGHVAQNIVFAHALRYVPNDHAHILSPFSIRSALRNHSPLNDRHNDIITIENKTLEPVAIPSLTIPPQRNSIRALPNSTQCRANAEQIR